ncbi:hypothetical protein QBA38_43990 [Streptomyces stelliscabiei]|uniref:hypothetical protein n=1 Tax=Streptomyces stelliscabiei TaxID=146820 RepID=UPI002FEF1A0B
MFFLSCFAEILGGGRLVLGAQSWGTPSDGKIFLVESLASGEQLPGHAEVDLGSRDPAGEEVIEAHGADPGAQGVLVGVRHCSAGVGPHGESEVVVFQRRGQSGAPVAGSAVGGDGHCAQLRGGSRAQRQVGEHLGAGRADERVVTVA